MKGMRWFLIGVEEWMVVGGVVVVGVVVWVGGVWIGEVAEVDGVGWMSRDGRGCFVFGKEI